MPESGRFLLWERCQPPSLWVEVTHLLGLWMLFAPGLRNSWGRGLCPGVGCGSRTGSQACLLVQWGAVFPLPARSSSPARCSPAWVGLGVSVQGDTGKLVPLDPWVFRVGLLHFPGGAVIKNLPASAGDTGLRPGLGRSHMPRSN